MSTVWISLTADGEVTEHDTKATLQDMQAAVGGWIEPVDTKDYTMMVNEDGLLIGLPLNPAASSLTGRYIVGNVCMVGLPDSYGNTKKLNKGTVERLRYALTGRVERL